MARALLNTYTQNTEMHKETKEELLSQINVSAIPESESDSVSCYEHRTPAGIIIPAGTAA